MKNLRKMGLISYWILNAEILRLKILINLGRKNLWSRLLKLWQV